MKSSKLAERMEFAAPPAEEPVAGLRSALRVIASDAATQPARPRRRGLFERRAIITRDDGFRPFRVL